jgi:hypothetical protein
VNNGCARDRYAAGSVDRSCHGGAAQTKIPGAERVHLNDEQ